MIHIIKKNGRFYKLMISIFLLILIQFVYAGTVKIIPPTTPQNFSINVNSTCNINGNDSIYWDGHAFVNGAVSSIETDPKAYNGTLAYNSSLSNYYPLSNPYNFINITGDTWSENSTNYYNKTQIDNNFSLYVPYTGATSNLNLANKNLNATNVTGFFGIFKSLYDYNSILTIDLNNHLLYDLASLLSLDFNDRVLYASDGTDKILDWYNVGLADFDNSNISTTANIISPSYCNSTNCYNITAFLKDETGIWTDTWSTNSSDYYNKSQVDNNLSKYLLLTGGTLIGNLTLPSINITTNYVCNSTNCYTINDFLIQTGSSYNETYANYVIANVSNRTYYWNNITSPSEIVIGSLIPSNVDLTSYALAVTYLNGSLGVLDLKGATWVLEGVDLEVLQDLYVGGTLYPNATLSRDIGSGALRWNVLWVANISSENIDNSGQIKSGTYCNSTGTCRDLSAWGSDVDLSLYYLKTEVDNNFTLYYTKIESNTNLNNNITDTKTYSNSILSGNLTNYYNKTKIDENFSLFCPYTGATDNVDLGIYNLTTRILSITSTDSADYSKINTDNEGIMYFSTTGNQFDFGVDGNIYTGGGIQANNLFYTSGSITGNSLITPQITSNSGAISFDDENLTTSSYGFFGWLGSLTNRITKVWITNLDINNTIQMNQGNITNATYIIMNEKSGACDLTINHSFCANESGVFIVG